LVDVLGDIGFLVSNTTLNPIVNQLPATSYAIQGTLGDVKPLGNFRFREETIQNGHPVSQLNRKKAPAAIKSSVNGSGFFMEFLPVE
jgi:hypothetical protein